MTSPPQFDYQKQLVGYLGAWRQLLESLAMLAGNPPWPVSPWGMPTTATLPPGAAFPPMSTSPHPPGSADYSQQLFGQLQAWRQYLEQATGATAAAAQGASGGLQDDSSAPDGWPRPWPRVPPDREDAGKVRVDAPTPAAGQDTGGAASDTTSNRTWPPPNYRVTGLTNENGTQWPEYTNAANTAREAISPINDYGNDEAHPSRVVQAAPAARGRQVIQVPVRNTVTQSDWVRAADLGLDSRVAARPGPPAAVRRAVPEASARIASPLFKGLAERAAQLNQNLRP